jgi:Ca2+-transporting ATPase
MILTDDNFTSIVNAVEEGRGIYDNIRKFVNYLLSCNMGEVLIIFMGALLGLPLPLTAVQLLWMNLVTDGLPAIALGVDPVSEGAMKRPPRKLSAKIMSEGMALNIFSLGAIICVASLAAFYFGRSHSVEMARTMAFTVLVTLEIVRLQMIRESYGTKFFSNKFLWLALLSSVVLQLIVIYSPMSVLFKTVPLGLVEWGYIAAITACVIVIGIIATKVIKAITKEFY